uniref:Fibronectin type-III domain-containing protein n=1 Tax=Rhizochromulina marina TaxID=1034831 RepID=A0A7S2RZZ2_9STRA
MDGSGRRRLLLAVALGLLCRGSSQDAQATQSSRHVRVSWDFDQELEGWAAASQTEMNAQIYPMGGELRGSVRGPLPHFDSPRMALLVDDRHHLVLRMRYTGQAKFGRAIFRTGGTGLPPATETMDHQLSDWSLQQEELSVVHSSHGSSADKLIDGDMNTGWIAPVAHDAWVVLDLGAYLEVTAIDVLITGRESSSSTGNRPRSVRLQRSESAYGDFRNVHSFTLRNENISSTNATEPDWQRFDGFSGRGRFWRVYVEDNWGGHSIQIQEVRLHGVRDDLVAIDFPIRGDGQWRTVALPVYDYLMGFISQIRIHPAVAIPFEQGVTEGGPAPMLGNSFSVDWIRVAVAPSVRQVVGCLDKFSTQPSLDPPTADLEPQEVKINGFLSKVKTVHGDISSTYPYAGTYNCLRRGGERITLRGRHLGTTVAPPTIAVAGRPCTDVMVEVDEEQASCLLPPAAVQGPFTELLVEVRLGDLPDLLVSLPYLSYQVPPPVTLRPELRNLAAHSLDVVWSPPGDYWSHVTVTGYVVVIREIGGREVGAEKRVVVGNVTTTTIIDLKPDTLYAAAVASLVESQTDEEWTELDLYGRRAALPGALESALSLETNATATLRWDIEFLSFNANATVNHSSSDSNVQLGPSGVVGGEGSYGIRLVGDANIENCNQSIVCCDGYNASYGLSSCKSEAFTCSQIGSVDPYYINGQSTREVPYSDPDYHLSFSPYGEKPSKGPSKQILRYKQVDLRPTAPAAACGPGLRLSGSKARQAGSAWYARMLNVREGFDTIFTFRVAEGSLRCNLMDDTYTHCRARGGDGLAFVIQAQSPLALGAGGAGLGYTGIHNSLAVEFDTYFNEELLEPYENHIAVHTRGWRHGNSANQSYALASSIQVPDLARDVHTARVVYRPVLDPATLFSSRFETSALHTHFLTNADHANGGMADFGAGVGQLEIYLDDLASPVLITPLDLGGLLHLDHGRAWVGFTGSTGHQTFQTQDILSWRLNQLRTDPLYEPAVVVNGVGAHACADSGLCVHM